MKRSDEDILKHNYIIEHLEKNAHKIKELIILSSFCFDNRFWNIKPLFQKSLKYDNDSYYFYDLFYEKLNLIIEIDEEPHEDSKQKIEDDLKEKITKEKLKCHFYRIRYHKQYGNIGEQIEQVKTEILKLINQIGADKLSWKEPQFNPFEFIKEKTNTIMVSVSPSNKTTPLNEMRLQISHAIHKVPEVTVIYLTGNTGTVATVYKVRAGEWHIDNSSSFHQGCEDFQNSVITSGNTFYKAPRNILLSPDLEGLPK